MNRFFLLVIVLAAIGWFAWSRFGRSAEASQASAAVSPQLARQLQPTAATPAAPPTTQPAVAVVAAPTRESAESSGGPVYPQMSLGQVLGPNNLFFDSVFGVSATYPEGWTVRDARRWGQNNRENTVFFTPPAPSRAIPSMYYQMYPEGAPAPANTEAYLREVAQKKEDSRSGRGANDYKNDPGSFVFREIEGRPTLSYFATYTQGEQVMAEYFMRILGQKGYVMFFVRGPAADIQAQIPTVYKMGTTVRVP